MVGESGIKANSAQFSWSLAELGNSLDAAVVAFNNLNEETMLTRKRKAGILLEKVETVYSRKQQLEEAFEKLWLKFMS